MTYLLDTDTCSAFLKGDRRVWSKVSQYSGRTALSVLTVGELLVLARRKNAGRARAESLTAFCDQHATIDISPQIAECFAKLRATMLDQGAVAPLVDLWIAATAAHNDMTVVTHNVRHFQQVPDIAIEDWLESA